MTPNPPAKAERQRQAARPVQPVRGILLPFRATVKPVFGNLRGTKRLDCFTLRGRSKVDGQWAL